MSSYNKVCPNSSGKCMYCNNFFHRLSTHMLLSETCMLASQQSLLPKRLRCDEEERNASSKDNSSSVNSSKILKRLHKLNEEYVCKEKSQRHSTHQHQICEQQNGKVDVTCDDSVPMDYSSDSSKLQHSEDCFNNFSDCNNTARSADNDSEESNADSIMISPIDNEKFHRPFTPEEHFMINLCNTCVEANAPLDLVDKIVAVMRDAQFNGLNFDSNVVRSREYFLKHLNKRFTVPMPESIDVVVEDLSGNDQVISVIRHNFLSQAMDLIYDHEIWGNMSNFVGTVDINDPFNPLKYGRCDNKVDEVVDGSWYKNTVKECVKIANGERFVVFGIVCYCDKTGTDIYQRNSLEPLSFTFCVFNRECRYKTSSWRTLGQLPDFDLSSSATHCIAREGFIGKGRSIRNFHACLETILSPFVENQGVKKPIYANICFGEKVAMCRVFFPFAYMMGDGLSSDKMCGRYLGYTNVNRLSRVCNISFSNSDNPECDCKRISMHLLQRKSNKALKLFGLKEFSTSDVVPPLNTVKKLQRNVKAELSQFSHHMHNSAFRKVWFGSNPNGITSATPTDLMHAYCHGVLVYVIKILIAPLNNQEKCELDMITTAMFRNLKSNQRSEYPRYMFTKITNLTLLTAAEWVGVAFVLAMFTISSRGQLFWNNVKLRLQPSGETVRTKRGVRQKYKIPEKGSISVEEEVPSGIICDPMDILYVLEMNLAFYAWYKRGEPFPVTDMASVSAVKRSIRILLNSIKEFTPRNHGNGWKLQKFHEHLHVPLDIYMFGSPQNYDNSPTEHGLIETAKRPADHAQKSRVSFISQVTKRSLETALIKKAHQALLRSRTQIEETEKN